MTTFAVRFCRRNPMGEPAYYLGYTSNRALLHQATHFGSEREARQALAQWDPPLGYDNGEVVELRQSWEVLRKIS